jgi:two-component system CheB/CheR fusion protein
VKIGVQPIPDEGLFLVSFIEETGRLPPAAEANPPPEDTSRVFHIEQELDETRNELNAAIRDLELSNEELRAANEEALSTNEEFQSANEELETSKEELQSLNEELTALNAQLHETLEQQRATAADLQNILNSSDVATLFLDRALNIRFFTPAAKALFGAIGTDIGRPLTDLAQRFEDEELIRDAYGVLANAEPVRREIESHDGQWFIRSILPYRIDATRAEGVVITFAGISGMKAAEQTIEAAKAFAESVITTVKQPLAVLGKDLRLISASPSFFRAFAITPDQSIGKPFTLAGPHDQELLARVLEPVQRGEPIEDLELTFNLGALAERTLHLSAREIAGGDPPEKNILVSIDDVTDAKARTDALAAARDEAEHANWTKSNFLAAASHDLRQPLQTMSLLLGMLENLGSDPSAKTLIGRLENTIISMSGLLDKLLDINQLEAGVVHPRPDDFEINDMLAQLNSEFGIHAANDGLALRFVFQTVWPAQGSAPSDARSSHGARGSPAQSHPRRKAELIDLHARLVMVNVTGQTDRTGVAWATWDDAAD